MARGFALALAALTASAATDCLAESAYISQVPSNVVTTMTFDGSAPQALAGHQISSPKTATSLPPEFSANIPHGNNSTQTLQIGSRNSVYHLQSGANNSSTAGVIGSYNNLTVLQAGNNLKSNVVLLNGSGLNVGVIQPNGSAPVNVIIARLPGGGLLIKR
jgi:hypothetical protein